MIKDLAPIVLFVYNRPLHTQRTVESLQRNDLAADSDLYIFSDGPKDNATDLQRNEINKVRQYIHTISGFRSVTICESATNKGLAHSVINGVTSVIKKYGKVIVVEDDLLLNRFFLRFMNEGLHFYEKEPKVFELGAFTDNIPFLQSYSHNVFASYRCESYGWATWYDRWILNDWEVERYDIILHPTKRKIKRFNRGGDDMFPMLQDTAAHRNDSWALRWQHCLYKNDALCVRPTKSMVCNIGFDGTGVHSGIIDQSVVLSKTAPLYDSAEYDIHFVKGIKIDQSIQNSLQNYFKIPQDSWLKKLKRIIKYACKSVLWC